MPYMKETCVAGRTIEVRKYYNFHVPPPGEQRGKRTKPTPESVRKANLRKAETDLRRLMNANFTDKDYHLTLTYRKAPGSVEKLRADAVAYLKKLKRLAKKTGIRLKYIYVIGAGPHRRHIHMVISGFSEMGTVSDLWEQGHISMTKLYTNGNYAALAAYFMKNAEDTRQEEIKQGMKPKRRFNSSHNLIKPEVRKEKIAAKEFRKDPRTRKGYHLIKDLTCSGISELTGMPYLAYTLIKDKNYAGNKPIYSNRGKRKRPRRRPCSIRAGDDTEERCKGAP